MFKTKIHSSWFRILLLIAVGSSLALISAVPVALAQGTGPAAQGTLNSSLNSLVFNLAMINTFMHMLILIALNMLQYLLQADYFNDPFMMGALNSIWVLSRNIMNVIFAVMLIGVALYTIITAKSELIKSKIATFVLAVVLVNFSWFFPRVIIDVANIMTATVYSIPNMLPPFKCHGSDKKPCEVITDILIMPNPAQKNAWKEKPRCKPNPEVQCPCTTGLGCYYKENYDDAVKKVGPAHAMINGMSVTFIRIEKLPQIPMEIGNAAPDLQTFSTTLSIVMNIMMTLIVQMAVVLPLLGLAVGFFIRILILWITIAFMPFTFLGLVINGKIGTNVFGFDKFDVWHEFIVAAFLPVIVAIPMVIGFIMLSASASVPAPAGFGQTWSVPLLNSVGSWWPFLWMFAAIGILWIGSFAALARSTITGTITEKIKNFGQSVFRLAVQVPLALPLPVGIGPPGSTVGTLFNAPRMAEERLRARSFNLPPGGGGGRVDASKVEALNNNDRNTQQIVDAIKTIATSTDAGARRDALIQIHGTVGGVGQKGDVSLEQLKNIIQTGNVPQKLKEHMEDLKTAIKQARATNL